MYSNYNLALYDGCVHSEYKGKKERSEQIRTAGLVQKKEVQYQMNLLCTHRLTMSFSLRKLGLMTNLGMFLPSVSCCAPNRRAQCFFGLVSIKFDRRVWYIELASPGVWQTLLEYPHHHHLPFPWQNHLQVSDHFSSLPTPGNKCGLNHNWVQRSMDDLYDPLSHHA